MSVIERDARQNAESFAALAAGRHHDPFSLLGLHKAGNVRVVRTLQPGASSVHLVDRHGAVVAEAVRVHADGLFVAVMPPKLRRYRLRISVGDLVSDADDPYRFPSSFGELDLHLLGEGAHRRIYEVLGAHPQTVAGVSGTRFAVWAPNASRVSVVGDFNGWDGRVHAMRVHPANGVWEIFIPGVGPGARYKFELLDGNAQLLPLKTDPFARYHEPPPGNASIVYAGGHVWQDSEWMAGRRDVPDLAGPVSIYEVHLGSWRRNVTEGNRWLSYRELADELVEYVTSMGFTHIELLPVTEHPFDGSWGYQPIGMYSPTQRFGEPDDLRYFIDRCHVAGIRSHRGLGARSPFLATSTASDSSMALRCTSTETLVAVSMPDWGTLIFNFGRREVVNYLIGSALFWIEEFHIDALRVDAVASMLYLDYSRKEGEWLPNEHGGNENLQAVAFLQRLNTELHEHGATSYAEESTAWPGVSRPVDAGGLGFTYKWNMGWMNDTLSYLSEDPVHRKHHHDKMTFSIVYAFTENFVLPLSHDEVVHGKRSLLGRMPGDDWQRFANLRAYFGCMFAHPGKKLLFMGAEIAQFDEWSHDRSLDWHLLDHPLNAGVQRLVRDLNAIYRDTPALHEIDFSDEGFEWIAWDDRDNSTFAWTRRDKIGNSIICVSNFTPVVRHDYRVGLDGMQEYTELINTDATEYGGSGIRNADLYPSEHGFGGRTRSLALTIPPLATLIIGPRVA